MINRLPLLAVVSFLGATAFAQQTALSEDFDGAFPPTGWSLVNNNGAPSTGWKQDLFQSTTPRSWHASEGGGYTSDNTMISPLLDLSSFSGAYLHFDGKTNWATYLANHPFSIGDGVSEMQVRANGGPWTTVWTDTTLSSGTSYSENVDISAFAGMTNVELGVHFFGTFAQEWFVDNILINDLAGDPPSTWNVNLPTVFAAVPFTDDFDVNAGVVPGYMALTNLSVSTGLPDVLAWANVGQLAPCLVPNSGAFNLEMGVDPSAGSARDVRNSMVIGIDGLGSTSLTMDYMGYNAGEENHDADGIWISSDGMSWFSISADWGTELPVLSTWTQISAMSLTTSPVDTSGQFYLMFQQEDNFQFNNLDGVGIDDIVINGNGGGGVAYSILNLAAGQSATFSVSGATAGGSVILGYSLTGAGPTTTQFGVVDMSLPIIQLTSMVADGAGNASASIPVPSNASGVTLYTQGVDISTGALTNSLVEVVL